MIVMSKAGSINHRWIAEDQDLYQDRKEVIWVVDSELVQSQR